jgi:hypothetical protein
MKFIATWIVIVAIFTVGLAVQWLPDDRRWAGVHAFGFMLLFLCLFGVPMWISRSCWFIKQALESASHGDWQRVKAFLARFNYPSPRYEGIIKLLLQISESPEKEIKIDLTGSNEFIAYDRHGFTAESKQKMLKKINSGWINGGLFESPKIFKILANLLVYIIFIKIILIIIGLFIK